MLSERPPRRHLAMMIGFPLAKGATMGSVTVAVVRAPGLSAFAQALIIAVTSAIVGAVGVILAAVISARASERVLEEQQRQQESLDAIKGAVGAQKRATDTPPVVVHKPPAGAPKRRGGDGPPEPPA